MTASTMAGTRRARPHHRPCRTDTPSCPVLNASPSVPESVSQRLPVEAPPPEFLVEQQRGQGNSLFWLGRFPHSIYESGTRASPGVRIGLLFLCADSPFRPPNWRWRLGVVLAEQGSPQRDMDPLALEIMGFLCELRYLGDIQGRCYLAKEYPSLYGAWQLYTDWPASRRWELEARLLTDETTDQLARRFQVETAVLDAYEQVFFNVRDRLQQRSFIMHHVIGSTVYTGSMNRATLWKLLAYHTGSFLLNAAIDLYRDPPAPRSTDAPPALPEHSQLQLKALIAALLMPGNDSTRLPLLRLDVRLQKLSQRRDADPDEVAAKEALAVLSTFRDLVRRRAFPVTDAMTPLLDPKRCPRPRRWHQRHARRTPRPHADQRRPALDEVSPA